MTGTMTSANPEIGSTINAGGISTNYGLSEPAPY
jgi:hypothetical protein